MHFILFSLPRPLPPTALLLPTSLSLSLLPPPHLKKPNYFATNKSCKVQRRILMLLLYTPFTFFTAVKKPLATKFTSVSRFASHLVSSAAYLACNSVSETAGPVP